jgi:hypothetical protein
MLASELKLAVYLDEAGDDLDSACSALKTHNLNYAVLRRVWTRHICDATDDECQTVRKTLTNSGISPVAISTDTGKVPVGMLARINNNRLFDLAQYFSVSQIKFAIGIKPAPAELTPIHDWMNTVTDGCLKRNITPLFEVSDESAVHTAPDVAALLAKHRRWKLLYDPVQLILKQNQDPFVRYWALLKQFVGAIDVRDFKIGRGYKPVGFGDAKIGLTLKDAITSSFKGWYYLEPGLGRRHGDAVTRQGTFNLAVAALNVLLSSV